MNVVNLRFNNFWEVESELKHNNLYLVQFPDDNGSPQIMTMRYNKVGKLLYNSIENRGSNITIILQEDNLDECSICNFGYYTA